MSESDEPIEYIADEVIQPIEIHLNGERYTFELGGTVAKLLGALRLTEKRLAVEINQGIVPRSQYADYVIGAEDQVEIVTAIGGG